MTSIAPKTVTITDDQASFISAVLMTAHYSFVREYEMPGITDERRQQIRETLRKYVDANAALGMPYFHVRANACLCQEATR